MRHAASSVLSLLASLWSASCRDAPRARDPAPEHETGALPASALAGAVRALETLDALRPEGALTQLRALECDTLPDRADGGEAVRVYLHLSVFAGTSARAREAFEEVRAALESEARATARVEPASAERVQRVMAMDWDRAGREELVSYSDVVRLAVQPGRTPPEPSELGSQQGPEAYDSLERYVRRAAGPRVGQVDLLISRRELRAGIGEDRFRIVPTDSFARFTRADIGAFLAALEGGSPAARLTGLKVERSQHEPDVHAERGWTFEAELTIR